MPLVQDSLSLAAGAAVDNLLSGSQWEFLPRAPRGWKLDFGLVGSAAGLIIDAYSGQDTLAEQMAPSIQNRFPIFPEDFTLTDVAAPGERIKIRVRNPTVGALTVFYALRLTPF